MTDRQEPRGHDAVDRMRRSVLAAAATFAGAALAPGVRLISPAPAEAATDPVTDKVRWGILIDTTRCTDCDVCVEACKTENGWHGHGRPHTDAQWIRKVTLHDRQTGATHDLPLMCVHCQHPPCEDVCPTGASFRRADGIVLVDKHICIGCRYCMMACPYKARSFVHEDVTDQKSYNPRGKGTVESCTMCVHRVDSGRIPACVEACGGDGEGAMVFGDLNDPDSDISREAGRHMVTRIRADLGLDPGVLYRGI